MANLQATMRATLEARELPSQVLDQANRLLHKSTSDDKFATVFLAKLDLTANNLTYANAGHDPAFLIGADGSASELAATGIPLGLFADMNYEQTTVALKPSDSVVIFTDGVTESMDLTQAQFGRKRILETITEHRGNSAREIGIALLNAVSSFSKGTPQSDDRTLLVLKRLT